VNSNVSPLCTYIDGPGGILIQSHDCGVAVIKNNRLVSLVTISVEMARACTFWQGRTNEQGS
jgi:hypothetical protein